MNHNPPLLWPLFHLLHSRSSPASCSHTHTHTLLTRQMGCSPIQRFIQQSRDGAILGLGQKKEVNGKACVCCVQSKWLLALCSHPISLGLHVSGHTSKHSSTVTHLHRCFNLKDTPKIGYGNSREFKL